MGNKCCICGRNIGLMNTYHRSFQGRTLDTCMFCIEALEQVDSGKPAKVESGTKYLRSEMLKGMATPEAALMVKETLKDISSDELKATLDTISVSPGSNPSSVSNMGTLFAGFVFLILAIILYLLSVNNNYGVANIPTTVFSAASFVAAIVCFAASSIIKAINTK